MSPLSWLPAYFVFGQQSLDVQTCAQHVAQYAADKASSSQHAALLIFMDQVLLHAADKVQQQVQGLQQV